MNNSASQHANVLALLLKQIADQKGITPEDIASDTGLGIGTVYRFFDLKFKPSLELFLEIAVSLGVNFFLEDKEGITDLTQAFNKAMDQLKQMNYEKL